MLNVDPATGLFQFADKNGKPVSTPNILTDRTEIINTAYPTLYGGIENSITYKGFQLDFLFQFTKQTAINYFFGNSPGKFSSGATVSAVGNQPIYVLGRWQRQGDVTNIQKFSSTYSPLSAVYSTFTDAAYMDASYIRLKNISLSKSLSEKWVHKFKVQDLKIFLQAQNVLTITSFKGLDPEVINSSSPSAMPPLRVIIFGFKISL